MQNRTPVWTLCEWTDQLIDLSKCVKPGHLHTVLKSPQHDEQLPTENSTRAQTEDVLIGFDLI